MVVDCSAAYFEAEMIGSGSCALASGLLVSWAVGGESIWWFLPVFIISFVLTRQLIHSWPALKRKLIDPRQRDRAVREQAMLCFVEHGLHRTRDQTGILILISLLEHRVQVLADAGINAKVSAQLWEEIVEKITAGLKSGQPCPALCQAITRCGKLVEDHFPRRDDDSNELPDLIFGDGSPRRQ